MKWRICCCLVLATVMLAGNVYADGGTLFKGKCGSCHKKGGTAAPVNPADKAAIVWQKYFDRGRHSDLSGTLSDSELQSVVSYLQAFAADSDKPETAAIPK